MGDQKSRLKHLTSKPVTNHNRITCVAGIPIAPLILDNTDLTSVKLSVLSGTIGLTHFTQIGQLTDLTTWSCD
ncbi:unnamed protein product [Ambrosiozyma monospora]|uniref:Unnamed protein product n=1 Tax=Ambrosiozyma monospora TaxID=43982 RepID=A0ACB5T288_AMBMO|nr:unnamed protein product [Ambrosiozyma monospora]